MNRNSKCHCGSGKKYKKCCLENDSSLKLLTNKSESLKKAYSTVYKNIYTYASQREDFNDIYKDASSMFFPEELLNYNEDINIVFNSYFLKDYVIKDTQTTIVLDFYKKYCNQISNLEANILYAMFTSHIGLYTVESISSTKLVLQDVLTKNTFEILDNLLSKHLNVGDKIIANVMSLAGLNIISEILYRVSSQSVLDTLYSDLLSLYNKDIHNYEDVNDFLRNHTLLFYCHIMQIISPDANEYFKNLVNNLDKLDSDVNINKNIENTDVLNDDSNSNSITLSPEIFNKIDSDYVIEVLDVLSASVEDNSLSKVSESGWVSAAEYHVKKSHGMNITQSQIAEKYNISTSTLGKRYKSVKEVTL